MAESVAVHFGVRIVIDPDGYRPNVGIVLMHPDGRVFWARRVHRDGWQFPQGGMNTDETPLEAMYRELREETGLLPDHVAVLGVTPGWLRYRLPQRAIRRNDRLVCIGQKQVWFLLRLHGAGVRPAPGPDREARIRPLALGGLLVPGRARGELQARASTPAPCAIWRRSRGRWPAPRRSRTRARTCGPNLRRPHSQRPRRRAAAGERERGIRHPKRIDNDSHSWGNGAVLPGLRFLPHVRLHLQRQSPTAHPPSRRGGVHERAELTMRTGAGATCGSCMDMAADLLARHAPAEPGFAELPVLQAA